MKVALENPPFCRPTRPRGDERPAERPPQTNVCGGRQPMSDQTACSPAWLRVGVATILTLVGLGHVAVAQTPPLQLPQPALLVDTNFLLGVNWQSYRGVPTSSVSNSAAGTDGRYQFTNGPSLLPRTTNQFAGFVGFSGIPVQGSTNFSTNLTFAANVANLKWPHSTVDNTPNGAVALIQRSAQVGASYFGQQVSFYFGQVVSVPVTDENGMTTDLKSTFILQDVGVLPELLLLWVASALKLGIL